MKYVFLFLPMFFLYVSLGNAQETIIKHTVEKGETVFQLSRTYNVTPEEIYALNPSAVDVIKIGEVLSIPQSKVQTHSTSNTITYAVVYGDTKYSLAKRFDVSIEDFELQNPHTKNGLQAGHIIKIKSQKNTSENASFNIVKTHLVLKGETLWGISKENGLTVGQLVNANADILGGILQIGQVLKVPDNTYGGNSDSDTYLVQRGDTKYGLSKKYGVTIDELERSNPHIVRMLMAGHTIKVPSDLGLVENVPLNEPKTVDQNLIVEDNSSSEEITETTKPSVQADSTNVAEASVASSLEESPMAEETMDSINPEVFIETTEVTKPLSAAYISYEIKPQETLYSLSKQAGMSISDFVTLNPQLENGAKVGMVIKMPSTISLPTQIEEGESLNQTNTATTENRSEIKITDLSQSIKTVKKNQILLVLPFSETKFNTDFNKNNNFNEIENEFLKKHLEFYRGVKIAQDSARALGLDFNIDILETSDNPRNTNAVALARESNIKNYDAIVIPFYENEVQDIAELVQEQNIPVVATSSIVAKPGLKNLYNAVPSSDSKRALVLNYLKEKSGNLVVVLDVARKENRASISNVAPNAKFIEVNKRGTLNPDDLVAQLDTNKLNYVILESEKNSVFLSTTNTLLGQLSNYDIQLVLLDRSLIPDTDEVSKKRFVILQMMYPSLSPILESSQTARFMKSYRQAFGIEPTETVQIGFDLTYDTLLRSSQANSFEVSAEKEVTEYTILKFNYTSNKVGGIDNTGIYIIQYKSDGSLKEIK